MTDQVFINCQNVFRAVFHRKGQGIVYILLLDRVPAPGKLGKLRQYLLRPLYILFLLQGLSPFPFRAISVTCKALSIFCKYIELAKHIFSCSAGISIMVSRIPINQFPSCCIFSASAFGSSCYRSFCTIPNGPDKTSFPFAEYRFVSLYILTSFL